MYITDMKKMKNILDTIFKQIIFFCLYWGIYAIIWHFATLIPSDKNGSVSTLYDAAITTPIWAIVFYFCGVFMSIVDQARSSSQSKKSSNKQP